MSPVLMTDSSIELQRYAYKHHRRANQLRTLNITFETGGKLINNQIQISKIYNLYLVIKITTSPSKLSEFGSHAFTSDSSCFERT